jgi:membrane protein implicated in regulation of membrane protease activity
MLEFFVENGYTLFWLAVAIATAVVEGMTCGLVSVWFVPGALVALVISFFCDLFWVQLLAFLLISLASLILVKTVFKKYLPNQKAFRSNSDALIGERGIVLETVDNLHETGSVKIRSLVWTARSSDDRTVLPEGSFVIIEDISGVKLICKPDSKQNADRTQK